MNKMIALYVKYSLQQPVQNYLRDSQGLYFGVTIAPSLILKERRPPRSGGSSGKKLRILGKTNEIFMKILISKVKIHVFETGFLALQALHFHFQINKSKNRKGFALVTLSKNNLFLLHQRYIFVTQRNSSVTNGL